MTSDPPTPEETPASDDGEPVAEPVPEPGEQPPAASTDEEERRYPSTLGGAFYIAVLIAAAVGISVAVLSDWRTGVRILAISIAAASLFRLALPQRDAGMLAVRNRWFDGALLLVLAGAIFFLAGDIPGPPTP